MRDNEEIQSIYRKRQRQGKQDLRFLSLLLFLGLLLYSTLSIYIITKITFDMEGIYTQFIISLCATFIMWCIPLRMLWKYNKLGKIVYWLCLLISIYLYRDAFSIKDAVWTPMEYQYIYIFLFVFKCLILIYGGIRLMTSKTIHSIWNVDDLFDEELAAMDLIEDSMQNIQAPISKAETKAKLVLKRSSITLGICLYITLIVIFVSLGLLGSYLSEYHEAISTIQYQLFSECLFSALLWSIPMIVMYMGKIWGPYLIYVAMGGEFLRICLSYVQYISLFTNKLIPMEIKLLFIIIALLRYLLLFFSCRSSLTHPYLRAYRRKRTKNNE